MSPVVAPRRRFSSFRVLSFLFANLVWLAPLFLAPATNAAAQITVTTLTDDAGNAANCPGAACSLRDAILAANGAPGSTIVFTGLNGTYTLTSALPAITASTTITGPGAGQLTVSGGGTIPAFTVTPGTTPMTVAMSGMTVANTANGFPPYGYGSGLFINQPGVGGTITVNITAMAFNNNTASSGGPAITVDAFNQGTLNITNTSFSGNFAGVVSPFAGGEGGAVYSNATLVVNDSAFLNNQATAEGSAIASFTNTLAGSGVTTINNSTFANNAVLGNPPTASGYGSIYTGTGTALTVVNSTFSGNTTFNGTATVGNGASIYVEGTLTLENTILVEPASGFVNQCGGAAACPTGIIDGDANGNFDDTNANLKLSGIGFHGGPTETLVPPSSSPVVCGGLAADFPGTTDQRGFPEHACGGGKVDAGSVQINPLVVTTTADSNDGACTTTTCSLRDAITAANTTGNGDISFKSGVTGTITLGSELPEVNVNNNGAVVNITGPGAGSLAVSGNNANRIISSNGTLSLTGMTFENGNSINSADGPGKGGAIVNAHLLSLEGMAFVNNTTGQGGSGGAIYNVGTITSIDQTTFSGNSVGTLGNGGAIDDEAGLQSITNSTFSGGTASEGSAIFEDFASNLTVDYSTFANNTSNYAGAFYSDSAAAMLTFVNDTFAGNTNGGASQGTGLFNDASTLATANTLFGEATECYTVSTGCTGTGDVAGPTNSNAGYAGVSNLGSFGGPTQTVLPLPGSSAICGGAKGSIPAGFSTDQRGYSNVGPGAYGVANCVDSGAVQTDYTAVAFNATSYAGTVNEAGSTPPILVDFTENGNTIALAPLSITTGGTAGAPTAGTTATTIGSASGFTGADFGGLTFAAQGTATLSEDLTVAGADVINAGPFNLTIGAGGTTTDTVTEAVPNPASFVVTANPTSVALSATVKHGGAAVTEGYLTFSVHSGSATGPVIGTAIGPLANTTGTVATTYTIPGNTAIGTYYVVAAYTDPGGAYETNSDTSQTITIDAAVSATQSIASVVLTDGHAPAPFTPVTGAGGVAPLAYSIAPALPSGLSISATTGAISGTPGATLAATTFTVTVKDADNNQATNTFSLTVNPAVTATQAIAAVTLTVGHAATPFTPVTGAGGTGALAYSIAPALPTPLAISATTGQITGTPTAALATTTYTVTVTDTNGATASKTFTLTINGSVVATQSVPAVALTAGHAIATGIIPVTGSGGTAPLTYGVSPALPTGLSYSTSTGAITGTDATTLATATYTVTVTDANSATNTNTFTLTVNPAVSTTQAIPTVTLTQNHTPTPFTPVTGSGGTAPLTYAISPALPTGLTFSTANGQIGGTPSTVLAATTFTVTVTDANGAFSSKTFSLTVSGAVTATQAIPTVVLTQNHTPTPFTPVTGSGGTAPLTYGIAPALPTGLTFSTTTGQIGGTPSTVLAATTFTVTVTDANSASQTATFSLTVNGAVTATQAVATTVLTQNHLATPFTPVTGSGGTAPLTYGVAPALPTGLSFNTANGQVTGTPTVVSAATTYTVTVTDANSATNTATFSLTVNTAVTATQAVATVVLTQNHAATPVTPVTGGGGTAPLTYAVAPALPAGLTFNTATGAITGTPTAASAAATYTVTVTDANNASQSATFSLTVNSAVVATQSVAAIVLTQNHAIAAAITPVTGSGGTGTLTYGVAPALPAGLSFSTANGQVTGTPSAVLATSTFTVTVTDTNGATDSKTFTLTVNGAVTATQAVPTTVLTENHLATPFTPVTGGGGTAPLAYAVSPVLPTGLSFNTANGQVTGTPTVVSASTTYTVTVTDANGATNTATFSLTVNSAVTATQAVASTVLTQNKLAAPFTPVTGSGGTAPLAYSVAPALPAGLSLNAANGQITGTPTAAAAQATYTVTVTDANNATATATFNLTINSAVSAAQTVATIKLTVNQAAAPVTPVTGSGGTAPLTYSVAPALPAGLSMASATGQITGTPTAVSFTTIYTVTVTDANGATATNTFNLTVNPGVTATQAVATTVLTQNHAATPFTPVTGAGGTAPLAYAVAPALPAGLAFSTSTGQVSGTPTAVSASTTYTVTVTDANGATGTATFNLTVNAAVTATVTVPTITLTQNNAATPFTPITGAGGTAPLVYAIAPALPAGLSFNTANGQITGTPTAAAAQATYTVTITDANNASASAGFSLTVNGVLAATQAVPTTSLTQNHAATPFTPVTGAGGTAPLTFAVAPALPAGLAYNTANGQITGTPTAVSAATTYTVTVSDSNSAHATATFSLTVNAAVTATQAIASTTLTAGHVAAPFIPVTGAGGTSPLTYSVAPALPGGLIMSATTGQITGTPAAASPATTYTVTVSDANGASAAATFSLTVNGSVTATVAIPSTVLTENHAATPFTPVTGAGGTAPLTYSVAPALPAGLTMSSANGQISGTPTVASAAATYTVTVTDAANATATAAFSLTVNGALTATTTVASTTLLSEQAATPFTPVTGAGGTAPLTYSVAPALPAGLTLSSSTGQITGTPTVTSNTTTYTVTVTDATSATATATFSLTVNSAGISITWANPAPINYGTNLAGVLNATVTYQGNAVPGTFVYTATPAGGAASTVTATTTLAAGTYTLTANFTPTNTTQYSTPAPAQVPLIVNQVQPTLAWTPAATLAYGSSLNGLLNATASYSGNAVPGSFAYTATITGGTAVAVTNATVLAEGSYTLAVTFTPTDATDFKTASGSAPLTVTGQTLTVTANPATKVYGTANPTFTGSITGAVNGDTFTESFTTTAVTTSTVGTYPIVPSAAGANLGNYNVVIDDGNLAVTQAGTTITLTASANSINPGSSLTFTATVASATTGSPTGSVSFYDGSTLIGTGTLAAGANGDVATLATSALLSGSHTITAVYAGDTNFTASSTASSITITVAPLGLTISATPSTQTGNAGTTFTYNLAVAPAFAGTPYPGPVSFAASGGPVGAVITFTPSTLNPNAGPQTVAMAVATSSTSAAVQPLSTGRNLAPIALALLLLPLAGTRRMRRNGQRFGRFVCLLLLALAGVVATAALSGCGASSGAAKGNTYTIVVTATSGSVTQSTSVTLTVNK